MRSEVCDDGLIAYVNFLPGPEVADVCGCKSRGAPVPKGPFFLLLRQAIVLAVYKNRKCETSGLNNLV